MNKIEQVIVHIDEQIAIYEKRKEELEGDEHAIFITGAIVSLKNLKHDILFK